MGQALLAVEGDHLHPVHQLQQADHHVLPLLPLRDLLEDCDSLIQKSLEICLTTFIAPLAGDAPHVVVELVQPVILLPTEHGQLVVRHPSLWPQIHS